MTLTAILSFILHVTIGVLIAIPLLLYPYLYFFQEQLIFHPRPMDPMAQQTLKKMFPKGEIQIQTSSLLQLHGWLINRPPPGQKRGLLIYFGGNAEEVSGYLLDNTLTLPQWAILSLNYRGYGASQGKPSEKSLLEDALSIYDWAIQQADIDPKQIVVMGRSLGSGVAVYLAAHRPIAAVILTSPYDSIRSVAQSIYPYVPIALLLKHPFDSLSLAAKIQAPMLMLLAEQDTIIPQPHSKRLAAAWAGKYTEIEIAGEDHNSINNNQTYQTSIHHFLNHI